MNIRLLSIILLPADALRTLRYAVDDLQQMARAAQSAADALPPCRYVCDPIRDCVQTLPAMLRD